MRLHRLEVEAFGPFADRTCVDFDTLSEAGLFLLSGATGAGKTSVLDAVCFALYGDVPGERSAAKRLRCDQAAPGVAPRVVLELTLGERRFRLERSPAWQRPKKRGTGVTTQQASVTLSELGADGWAPLSSRLDETGDLVARLIGMNLTQFTQVALLPQGRFQTFLRARSEERHQLLQQLFRTGRFAEVERWLRERRVLLGRADAEAQRGVADVVSRISETTGRALPEELDVGDEMLTPWATRLLDDARRGETCSREAAAGAGQRETEVRQSLEHARSEVVRRARHDAARDELDRLEAGAVDHARDLDRLAAARRAASVVPLHRQSLARAAECRQAARVEARALATLVDHLGLAEPPSPDELEGLTEQAVASTAAARAMLPRVARRARAAADLVVRERETREVAAEVEAHRAELGLLPARLDALRHDVAEARAAHERLPGLLAGERLLVERLAAHDDVVRVTAEVEDARREWLIARENVLVRREQLLDLQQARIEGMAAELAGALAVGCSCPVCGSADHPAKAAPAPGAPDARAEKSARTRVDDASLVEHAFAAKVHELETGLAAAGARAGERSADEVSGELAELRLDVASTRPATEGLDGLVATLGDAEHAHRELGAAAQRLETRLAALRAEVASLRTEVDALGVEVQGLLDGTPFTDLADLVAHGELTESLCREALAHHQRRQAADGELAGATAAASQAAAAAGFSDADAAVGAALAPDDLESLAAALDRHRTRLAAVREVLAEPRASDALGPRPDVAALAQAHVDALELREETAAAHHVAAVILERLTGLVQQLGDRLAPWRALRADLDLTTRLAGFVEGTSVDNVLRMRLSAYVLAYRLGQVVAAANERLARMSDQRYSLEHTGRRGAGETRGGLSLLVRDDWSGETRDPATLSGGETFVVSLALALGLSDVVTGETGGAALDTLFVDEGFGSLDADTLDDVMDTLDSLRDGGRVVGLVSHVAEMRDRIPTQLVVTKARGGSSVRLRGC